MYDGDNIMNYVWILFYRLMHYWLVSPVVTFLTRSVVNIHDRECCQLTVREEHLC